MQRKICIGKQQIVNIKIIKEHEHWTAMGKVAKKIQQICLLNIGYCKYNTHSESRVKKYLLARGGQGKLSFLVHRKSGKSLTKQNNEPGYWIIVIQHIVYIDL